jgi:hypothetical protein
MSSATHTDHVHCVRVRAQSALRPAGPRQRRPLVGRPRIHRGLYRIRNMTVRRTVGNGGARVLKTITVILVHHCRHNRIPVARTVVHRVTYQMRER